MKKCALCGQPVDKKKRVEVSIGRWYRRKRRFFHLDCFIADKRRGFGVVQDLTKS